MRILKEATEKGTTIEEINTIKGQFFADFHKSLSENVDDCVRFYGEQIQVIKNKIDNLTSNIYSELENGNPENDDPAILFHKKLFILLLSIYEIRSFLEINKTATHNIIKKFAKKLNFSSCVEQLAPLELECFEGLPTIEEDLIRVEELFLLIRRNLYTQKDTRARQDIIVELHKSVENSLMWKQSTVLDKWSAYTFKETEFQSSPAPIKIFPLVLGTLFMLPFMIIEFFPKGYSSAQRACGMLVFCSTLWATSAVPLWVTSLSIPLICVLAKLIPAYSSYDLAKYIQKSTMSSTIYLIMGGFTIAAAFKETEMDKRIASAILSKTTGNVVLFAFSCIALNALLACFINNIASTMIVITILIPTLNSLPNDCIYSKILLLGVAAGGNFGGMMTPLSSPQNAVTIQAVQNVMTDFNRKPFGFSEFLMTAFPLAFSACVIQCFALFFVYKNDIEKVPEMQLVKTDFGWRQISVSIISVLSIALWILLPFGADKYFGDNGIIGFIPILLFYGSGILKPSQIFELPWNILFIIMGGNALGTVVNDSGLLGLAKKLLKSLLGDSSLWVTLLIISLLVAFIDFFVSHTISSTITLPLICSFAAEDPHLRLYAMSACIATTSSQILPVSSFPNLCCLSLQNKNGKEFLTSNDIIKGGSMATFISLFLCNSMLYFLGLSIGL